MYDGDLVTVIDEPIMMAGVDRSVPVTMDVEDKVLALSEEFNKETIYNVIIRNNDNRIGDYSNYATCYHNKMVKSEEQKQRYTDYISLLSVSTGKEID